MPMYSLCRHGVSLCSACMVHIYIYIYIYPHRSCTSAPKRQRLRLRAKLPATGRGCCRKRRPFWGLGFLRVLGFRSGVGFRGIVIPNIPYVSTATSVLEIVRDQGARFPPANRSKKSRHGNHIVHYSML